MEYVAAVILPQLLHGVVFGAALGLLALGLTVIFGLLGVMNFAHGELFMFGAYAGIAVIGVTQSFWIALIIKPIWSRAAHRLRLATTSLASTGSPSWNLSPGRSRNVQVRPSADTSSASKRNAGGAALRRSMGGERGAPCNLGPLDDLALELGLEPLGSSPDQPVAQSGAPLLHVR